MAGENDRKVGVTIRRMREMRGISAAVFARRLGMSESLLADVEEGTYALRLTDVFYCADALGCDAKELMNELGMAVRAR